MTDQTESASEYADLLTQADHNTTQLVASLASALRALEAKVREKDAQLRYLGGTVEVLSVSEQKLRAERDRLAGEVERLEGANVALCVAHRDAAAEVARLTSELAAAREQIDRMAKDGGYFLQMQAMGAELAAAREALRVFVGAAYPVATEIDPRGHAWSEAYLDEALSIAHKAIDAARRAGGE